jgi:hypothetical protein
MLWPWERADEVLARWVEWCRTAPDAISTSARLLQVPPLPDIPEPLQGRCFVAIDGAYLGSSEAAAEVLRPLRELEPEMDMVAPIPAAALSHIHMDPEQPVPGKGDGMLLDDLTPAAVRALVEAAGPSSGSPLLSVELRQLGGALATPPAEHGALAKIGAQFALFSVGMVMSAEAAAAIEAHMERVATAMDPWDAGRRYLNFTESVTDAAAFFPEGTLRRLREVKHSYDPDNLFQANHEADAAG